MHLQEIDEAREHRARILRRAGEGEVVDRVDDEYLRLEVTDELVDRREVHLQSVEACAGCMEPQQPLLDPRLELQADRAHVAHDLRRRLLEREIEAPLAALARGIGEVRRDAALAAA